MRARLAFGPWPFKRPATQPVGSVEAERLIGLWGEAAYGIAQDLAWREDMGLLHTTEPGYWSTVARQIGDTFGIAEGPAFDNPDRKAA